MKRLDGLYERIISEENLRLADEKARRGKTHLVPVKLPNGKVICKRVDNYGIRLHDKHRERNIHALHEALKNKTFKTSEYEVFPIYEPKERIIYRLPYYPDRIVHHAIMNILEPIWTKIFTYNTYSCIKGRGIEGCARQVEKIIARHKGKRLYCLKIDIRKYYPSINHEVLKGIVRKKIKDKDLLWLLDEIIDSADGLPIGNYLSQYLANLYLSYFMHFVNETLKVEATEYADDIVFFSESKERLHEVFGRISEYLEGELRLHIKDNWQIFPIAVNKKDKTGRALDYVGFCFYMRQKLIRKRIKKNMCRRIARLNMRKHPLTEKAYKQAICSWLGWVKHSNSKHLLRKSIKRNYYDSILR